MTPTSKGRTVFIGLLATTDYGPVIERCDDSWMETDFVSQYALWTHTDGYDAERSVWLTGKNLTKSQYLFGDPAAPRICLPPPTIHAVSSHKPAEKTLPEALKLQFITDVTTVRQSLKPGDTLVIGIWGHGIYPTTDIAVGSADNPDELVFLSKSDVEEALDRGTMQPSLRRNHTIAVDVDVFLISGACFSGAWKSKGWTLLAASRSHEESSAMVTSDSEASRGGIFAYSFMAAAVFTNGVRLPRSNRIVYNEKNFEVERGSGAHDIGRKWEESAQSATSLQACEDWVSMEHFVLWLNEYRASFRRLLYDEATFVASPARQRVGHILPDYKASIHDQLFTAEPNPARKSQADHGCHASEDPPQQYIPGRANKVHQPCPDKERVPVSMETLPSFLRYHNFENEVDMIYTDVMAGTSGCRASQIAVCSAAQSYRLHPSTFTRERLGRLQKQLKEQHRVQCLYWLIACSLGWENEAYELWTTGFTFRHCVDAVKMREGAKIFGEMVLVAQRALGIPGYGWTDPYHWIRGVWRKAGFPDVEGINWEDEILLVKDHVPP